MNRWLMLLGGVVLVACPPVKPCSVDSDCGEGGQCTGGVCVALFRVDSGADAGVRVDGGGVQDAGERDGGLDAGRVDGGDSLDAGPDAGPDAGSDAGVDAGPLTDAGADAGDPEDAGGCSACADGFACDAIARACSLQVTGLVFVRPDAGELYGGSRPVRLEVQALVDAGVTLPATLTVQSTAGFSPPALVLTGTGWVVDTVTPADGGVFVLRAALTLGDAGFEATTVLTVDARRPLVTLVAEPAPPRTNDGGFSDRDPTPGFASAWKRDELLELRVESPTVVRVGPADFGLPPGSVTARACSSPCPGRSCQCFSVDLARVRLDGLRAVVDAGLGPVADALGNLSAPTSVALPITRWRWRRVLLESNQSAVDQLHAPVLDDDGRVHVGVGYANSNQGALWQLTPSGDTRYDFAIDDVAAQPMVQQRVLFAQGDNSQVRRYDTAQAGGPTLTTLGAGICANEKWEGTSAVVDQRLFLLGWSGRVHTGTGASLTSCESWSTQPGFPDMFAVRGVLTASPLASTASRLFFGRLDGRATSGLMRVDYFPQAAQRFQGERTFGAPNGVTSLAVFDEVVAATSRGPATAPNRSTVAITGWNAELTARFEGRVAVDGGTTFAPLVAAGPRDQPTFLFGDGLGALRRFSYVPPTASDAGVFTELPAVTGVDPLEGGALGMAAPVIGANGLVYLVSPASGRLTVVNAQGAVEWTQANAFTPGAVSPALDVLRDRSLAKQCARGLGLLYVAARNDSALTAVIVDSPGLDGTSPWPRFHHDNGATGNPTTPLGPWACP